MSNDERQDNEMSEDERRKTEMKKQVPICFQILQQWKNDCNVIKSLKCYSDLTERATLYEHELYHFDMQPDEERIHEPDEPAPQEQEDQEPTIKRVQHKTCFAGFRQDWSKKPSSVL